MSDVGVCGEVQVVPSPAALPGQDALAPLQPPAPPEPPAPLLQPVTLGAPLALYQGYKPVGMGELQKGGMLASSLVDNARRGPQPTICEHNLPKSKCKTCKANARICKHNKKKELCRECDGSALCIHDLRKKECRQCDGSALCSHNKIRRECKECGGSSYCEHGKRKRRCRECGGMDFCQHDRRKGQCKECGGSQICMHNRQKFRCKECYMCVHYRVKTRCPDCIAVDQEKDSRKLPRGQGWNAKRLREEGLAMGVDAMPAGADGMAGVMQVVGVVVGHDGIPSSPVPKKHAPGGIKKDNGAKRLHCGQPGSGGMSNELGKEGGLSGRLGMGIVGSEIWAVEKAQLVQENQQLRNEAEERRRAAAELEKARAEIERLKNLLGTSPQDTSLMREAQPPPPTCILMAPKPLQPPPPTTAPTTPQPPAPPDMPQL